MTFVIIAAGIDLSVGAVLGLCSVMTATLLVNEGWGLWSTLPLVVIVTGVVFGAAPGCDFDEVPHPGVHRDAGRPAGGARPVSHRLQ